MAEIVWTEPALDDLEEIANYIALDKLSAAQRLVQKIFDRIDLLSESPNSGRRVPELSRSKYKEVIVGPCRIFYRFSDDTVYVLHVMRAEREMRKYMLQDRDLKGTSIKSKRHDVSTYF
ncbi:MAG: type II toxin-antitoxin system RelE/ParE family toxin [Gammaproteobacteria bacterium]|mgnify:FL=1|jgi:toxin ParE1/3/4|nr:plasmid stabilization protein [Gammaproteobacteria bacterium]MDP6095990.1 type II toxin-antitoxin system RelE/ParE family toxin [Gammaproteobacteria bacterium]MDP7455771.1 type II toxin-antitoxin system RelE/ParE family toxin [Gammaproteobacteria bacterium]|tara:strand:+ start:791 stop:1147 length:357 start_codon:yes stop_codon:yes gene_type:complete